MRKRKKKYGSKKYPLEYGRVYYGRLLRKAGWPKDALKHARKKGIRIYGPRKEKLIHICRVLNREPVERPYHLREIQDILHKKYGYKITIRWLWHLLKQIKIPGFSGYRRRVYVINGRMKWNINGNHVKKGGSHVVSKYVGTLADYAAATHARIEQARRERVYQKQAIHDRHTNKANEIDRP